MRGFIMQGEARFRPTDAESLPPFVDGCDANSGGAHDWQFVGVTTIADPPHVDYRCEACRLWASRNSRDERDPERAIRWSMFRPKETPLAPTCCECGDKALSWMWSGDVLLGYCSTHIGPAHEATVTRISFG